MLMFVMVLPGPDVSVPPYPSTGSESCSQWMLCRTKLAVAMLQCHVLLNVSFYYVVFLVNQFFLF